MTEKKVCFLMPLYKAHFENAKKFLASFKKYKLNKQADMFFCFSTQEESAEFKNQSNIIIPPQLSNLTREQGIINVKKLYGVNKLAPFYKYIIVVDSDMIISKSINLLDLCDSFFQNKILWGNLRYPKDEYFELIHSACSKYFDDKDKIDDNGLGLWFNNACIYKGDTINDFMEKTSVLSHLTEFNFWSFDYYIYMYYLLLYQGFTTRNLCPFPSCESKGALIDEVYAKKFMFMATDEFFAQVKKLGGGDNCFIKIHLDRPSSINVQPNLLQKIKNKYWIK